MSKLNPHFVEWNEIADKVAGQINVETKMRMRPLILSFVTEFCLANSNGPTVEEICWAIDRMMRKFRPTSTSSVNYILEKLEAEGEIASYRRKNGKRVGGRIKKL